MAPGCSISNDQCQSQMIIHYQEQSNEKFNSINTSNINFSQAFVSCYDPFYLDQIPLPSTPAPPTLPSNSQLAKLSRKPSFRSLETVDSFEILEQTIMKQKRLGKNKNTDLRTKVLLKRTFNLVCEMMDEENGLESNNNLPESDSHDKEEMCQNTLIINLNESETLDLFQSEENDVQNFIELENFNYENLLEDEHTQCSELDKNKSFLTVDFFRGPSNIESQEENDSDLHNNCYKRRRSSADDDTDFDDFEEENYETESSFKNTNYFSDLTNSSTKTNKKRALKHSEVDSKTNSNKKFKESLNIVT